MTILRSDLSRGDTGELVQARRGFEAKISDCQAHRVDVLPVSSHNKQFSRQQHDGSSSAFRPLSYFKIDHRDFFTGLKSSLTMVGHFWIGQTSDVRHCDLPESIRSQDKSKIVEISATGTSKSESESKSKSGNHSDVDQTRLSNVSSFAKNEDPSINWKKEGKLKSITIRQKSIGVKDMSLDCNDKQRLLQDSVQLEDSEASRRNLRQNSTFKNSNSRPIQISDLDCKHQKWRKRPRNDQKVSWPTTRLETKLVKASSGHFIIQNKISRNLFLVNMPKRSFRQVLGEIPNSNRRPRHMGIVCLSRATLLCLLNSAFLLLLLLLAGCTSSIVPTVSGQHLFVGQSSVLEQQHQPKSTDLEAVLPPFAPTRRPTGTNVDSASQSEQIASTTEELQLNQKGPNSSESRTTILQGSASAISGSSLPQNFYTGASSSLSPKFTRTNELDAFLDEMNHKELRTVAAGRPIDDMFQPKPFNSVRQQVGVNVETRSPQNLTALSQDDNTSRFKPNKQADQRRERNVNQLIGSHSEQQIYSECALILQRTYVKNIDDPKHQLVPFGKTEQACISYKHIDKAIEQAKHKLKFREFAKMRKKPIASGSPMKPPIAPFDVIHKTLEPPEDLVAAIGEINMATTQIIADQFDLSNDELLNGLPLIDMSKTKFWDICPLYVKQDLKCEISRFRTFTGHCNNVKHPTWGAAKTPYARYLPPVHPDGIWVPRKSIVSEITFDLGIGHRETHAHIAPSMPLPRIHNEHHGHENFPSHRQHIDHAEMSHESDDENSASAISTAPPLSTTGNNIDNLARQADQELSDDNRSQDMALASSVQFVRRAPLTAFATGDNANNDERNQAHNSMALESIGQPATPALGLEASATQFQQQAGNFRNFLIPPNPIHLSHFQHQQQAASIAMAASHHPIMPPILGQSYKSRSIPQELPSARLVTSIVHRDMDVPNHDFSVLFMSWGQLLDHDMTRAAQPPATIKCCPQANGEPASNHKLCLPIQVPANDPFYSKFNVQCLEFRRSLAGVRPNCVLGPRVHQNANTSPIDANFVYGSSQETAEALRLFKGGRLRDRDWFHREGLKPLLPAQEIDPDLSCLGRPKDLFCFLAGDIRVNEQTHLTVLHTLYMREHNRLADRLSELNPHWDDERIFQEARHIVAAGVQHVLINEYIPLLIGRKMTELYNLTAQPHVMDHHHQHHHHQPQYAFWHGYDPTVTTSVSNSFAAAAFRQGHTFVQSTIDRFNKFHEFVASEKLRHLFMQPFLLYQPGVMDELVSGLINKQSQSYDPFISEEISGHLFQPPEQEFGHDLAAINLQRGREQGLPGYNLFREWCGLPRAETFEQLEPYLTNHTAHQYSRIYKHVDDIDLWSGGVSERKLPGSAIGPTFACIIARQFSNTRRGDRFWYENPGLPSSFTPDQLAEIRKVTMAKILCTNADDLPTIQRWAFRMPHPVLNPRVECHSLPEIDLQYWQEE